MLAGYQGGSLPAIGAIMATRNKTTKEIADVFDVHITTVNKWIQSGCPHDPRPKGTKQSCQLDEGEVASWLKEKGLTGKAGKPKGPQSAEKEALELRKLLAITLKHERENAEHEGRLIDVEQERARDLQKITVVKNKFSNLGQSLSSTLVGMNAAEIQATIEISVNDILKQLSEGN